MFCYDIDNYIKECNICLASKAVQHMLYVDLKSLPVFIHCWKNLSMDFIIGLPISID